MAVIKQGLERLCKGKGAERRITGKGGRARELD